MTRLDKLPYHDAESEALLAVVETPRGGRNKYDYDPELKLFRLAGVLPEGTVFPYDFGFFPSTKAADGDQLFAIMSFAMQELYLSVDLKREKNREQMIRVFASLFKYFILSEVDFPPYMLPTQPKAPCHLVERGMAAGLGRAHD